VGKKKGRPIVTDGRLPPAFYGLASTSDRRWWADCWVLLHPPYTLWHLSYVAIGASVAPTFDGGKLAATLFAFFLAVGVGAHALDELQGRPLQTVIPKWALVGAAATSLIGALVVGAIGVARVGPGLVIFMIVGVLLNCGYNLELLGGRLHNNVTFALAWGAFPVLTAYYAQAETFRAPAFAAAIAAYCLSAAQRSLSTSAREIRRRVTTIEGTITYNDGRTKALSSSTMLAPIERALKATAVGLVALAVSLVTCRLTLK
jgi:hypothetical protein